MKKYELLFNQLAIYCKAKNYKMYTEKKFDTKTIIDHITYKAKKYRLDFAVVGEGVHVGIEVQGGIFSFKNQKGKTQTKGGHTSISGRIRDIDKANRCAISGWWLLQIESNRAETLEGVVEIIEQINYIIKNNK